MNGRPIEDADLPCVLELMIEDEEAVSGRRPEFTLDDVREWVSHTKLAEDSWLVEMDDDLAAAAWVDRRGDGVSLGIGLVHPRFKAQGIGLRLVDRSEERGRAHGSTRMQQVTIGPDDRARELMLVRGYREVRRFYTMAIELDAPPDVPAQPEIQSLREGDERVFHAALEESFRDHWEHHPVKFEDWWERRRTAEAFDPTLWFLVREGGEVAAVARNEANRNGGGYVGHLGVRRSWRGRGYGKALLLHSFRELYNRGLRRITLGVDADSPTGATRLYESVGMHVEDANIIFEKELA